MANNTKETYRWKVMLKRHRPSNRPDVCVFYDEDKNTALKEMRKYVKSNGFSIAEKSGCFIIADVLLVQCRPTGEVISETPYCMLFDVVSGELIKGGEENA